MSSTGTPEAALELLSIASSRVPPPLHPRLLAASHGAASKLTLERVSAVPRHALLRRPTAAGTASATRRLPRPARPPLLARTPSALACPRRPADAAAIDSAVEMQETDSESSENPDPAGPQALHRERTGGDPAPARRRSSSRAPHPAQATRRRWRATRKLAPCTRASHAQQRNAASASQCTAAAPPQSSQPLHLAAFIPPAARWPLCSTFL